jgi:hypothetical protein
MVSTANYSDYRDVEGVFFPFLIKSTVVGETFKTEHHSKVESITINPVLNKADFKVNN